MKQTTYQTITNKFIELLERGTVPWIQPWSTKAGLYDQQNLITQHQYRGVNAMLTMSQGYESPYWLTYKQAGEIGANVKKGEKGTPIVYWIKRSIKDKNDDEKSKAFMTPKTYVIFNVAQLENLDLAACLLKRKEESKEFNPIEACENVVKNYHSMPELIFKEQRAFYRPMTDVINMPRPETFDSESNYYATLFHEMIHSTGHKGRLNRESLSKVASFGSHEYSKEELVAELGSAFLCSHTKIDSIDLVSQSAAYLKSWISVLKNDSKFILQASSQAQKAADLILNIKREDS